MDRVEQLDKVNASLRQSQNEVLLLRGNQTTLQQQIDHQRRDHDTTIRSLQSCIADWEAKWREHQTNKDQYDHGTHCHCHCALYCHCPA